MTDEVGHIQVTGITEHEDGGATIEFDMDDPTILEAIERVLEDFMCTADYNAWMLTLKVETG